MNKIMFEFIYIIQIQIFKQSALVWKMCRLGGERGEDELFEFCISN